MENGDVKVEQKIEQKVGHFIISKPQLIISLCVFVATICGLYWALEMKIQTQTFQIELIKQNDFAHIEAMQKNIETITKDYQDKYTELKTTQVNLMTIIGDNNRKLDTLIGQHQK